jgi:hypothetical protein
LESLAAVPTGAIIPFEVGKQQFSEFPYHTNLATNMEAAEYPPFPIPFEGGETSIVKCGGADLLKRKQDQGAKILGITTNQIYRRPTYDVQLGNMSVDCKEMSFGGSRPAHYEYARLHTLHTFPPNVRANAS